MRRKMLFVAGLGVGYVLGTRAGRERYEQLKGAAQRVADNPRVQEAAGLLGARVSRAANAAKDLADDKLGDKSPFRGRAEHREREKVTSPTGWPESDIDRVT
ncbi:hypothetical protein Aph01nite_65560 [Acrocarpospora phusangensis]|uniref:YtxH domain-containing protein n=1 Tax=Acrocarpospora phusangensis TaxID=1070424 RepID=A0A919UN93_9ACTN|nr:YtxH domain-containing protein [Acrocarpospora phusangensis]GIH28246.1 hypothetical protein Aph01nite_65560 [Acrocarpospora phusangensis]